MIQKIALLGRTFGRWCVIGNAPNRQKSRYWLCRCDCGTEREVFQTALLRGSSLSCGCLARELTGSRCRGTGKKYLISCDGRPENRRAYKILYGILDRCYNPKHKSFEDYGRRGIRVCDRWQTREGLANFLEDMGIPPEGKTLDRRDNSKGYSPDNCRWATSSEQLRNTRVNRVIEFRGESLCVADWADRTGIPGWRICQRLDGGWSVERALTTPVGKQGAVPGFIRGEPRRHHAQILPLTSGEK